MVAVAQRTFWCSRTATYYSCWSSVNLDWAALTSAAWFGLLCHDLAPPTPLWLVLATLSLLGLAQLGLLCCIPLHFKCAVNEPLGDFLTGSENTLLLLAHFSIQNSFKKPCKP